MTQKLKHGRNLHTAFLIPDNIANCKENWIFTFQSNQQLTLHIWSFCMQVFYKHTFLLRVCIHDVNFTKNFSIKFDSMFSIFLKMFFGVPRPHLATCIFFLSKYCIEWTRIGSFNRPDMALTPFPSSVGWDKIQTHDLLIASLVCYPLEQGSQTQIDSLAAWDSKKGLAGRIEKSEKNYPQIFI